ncbi:DUF2130 domain-containing protein [Ureaplasma canigenitalium]|uniref:DUF2130 domain-containing protein n=1 Tax=Ureaplasma canigenitalium TaxID=42092 RepID=UPI0004E0D93F|nr:DUF2130 domain-containing protein [Ureaplasma canigenitalium]
MGKLKIIDFVNLQLQALEDIHAKEIIQLKTEETELHNAIQEKIEDQRDEIIKKWKEEEKESIINNFRQTDEYKKLKDDQKELELTNERYKNYQKQWSEDKFKEKLKEEEENWKNKFFQSEEYKTLENTLNDKDSLIKELKQQLAINKENIISKYKAEDQEYNELKALRDNYQLSLENEKIKLSQIKDKEKEEALRELQKQHDEELLKRNSLTTKELGEDFEREIINMYDEHFHWDRKMNFTRTTVSKDGNKPDFRLDIYDRDFEQLTEIEKTKPNLSIIFEAKTKFNTTEGQKNEKFFKKLDKDRENYGSQYAVLITELEPESSFAIKSINEYRDMYMIRPFMFETIVNFFRLLASKAKAINDEISFFKKQELEKEFNEFKKYFDDKIRTKINDTIDTIQKQADILDKVKKALEEKVVDGLKKINNDMEKKLEKNLNPVLKKLEKNEGMF